MRAFILMMALFCLTCSAAYGVTHMKADFEPNVKQLNDRSNNSIQNQKTKIELSDFKLVKSANPRDSSYERILDYKNNVMTVPKTYTIGLSNLSGGLTASLTSQSGSTDFAITGNTCLGYSAPLGTPCYIDITFTPSTLGPKSGQITFVLWGGPPTISNTYFYFNLSGSSYQLPPKDCAVVYGSIVRTANRSLGETIPIVGADFDLYYSSEFAYEYSSTTFGSLQYSEPFNRDAWNPSIHHFYSWQQHRLFLGTGSTEERDYKDVTYGNRLVVSSNRDEIYIFSPVGVHLETKTFLTGATKYTFGYDSMGNLAKITDAFGNDTVFNRSSAGNLNSIIAPRGQVTRFTQDSSRRLLTATNPNNEKYVFTYKQNTGLLETFSKPGRQVTTFSYDNNGKLIRDQGHGGNYWELGTNPSGDLTRSSRLSRVTTYTTSYDSFGNYNRNEISPANFFSTTFESPLGNSGKSSFIESVNNYTMLDERFGAEAVRPKSQEVLLSGAIGNVITSYDQSVYYDPAVTPDFFNFTSITNKTNTSGRIYTEFFDNISKYWMTTTPEGVKTTTFINMQEQPITMKIGNDTETSISYDSFGRVIRKVQGSQNEKNYFYNKEGYLSSQVNALSEETSYLYDRAGRVTQTTLPDLRSIKYTYDENGNVTSITPPNKPAHYFQFNAMELPLAYQPPLIGSPSKTTYVYNYDKQLTQIALPTGNFINYSYNSTSGLLESVILPTSTNFTFRIPNSELVDSVLTSYGTKNQFTYRGYNVASDEQLAHPSNYTLGKVSFGFDSDNRVTSRTVRGNIGSTPITSYITLNNDSMPTQYGNMVLAYTYPSGRLSTTGISLVTDSRVYDAYGNLTTYTASVSGTPIYSYTLTRDSTFRITGVSETVSGVTDVYEYIYDSAGRLVIAKKNSTTVAYLTYDSNSNRTSGMIDGITAFATYDNQDRLLGYGANAYSYDNSGVLKSIQNSVGATSTYNYDAVGSLLSATDYAAHSFTYVTDALDRKVKKVSVAEGTRRFIYQDNLRIAAETDNPSNLLKTFMYPTNSHTPDYMRTGGVDYRIITNHLGSPRLVVKTSDGTVAQKIDYNVFGKITADTNPNFQPFGFAGGLYDSETKLVRFGARDYDAETGRWTSKDPIGFKGGDTNLYGYVLNDPVNAIDPEGKGLVGIVAAGVCALVDGYNMSQTYNEIKGFQNQIKDIQNQIKSLDVAEDCDKILALRQQANKLALQLASAESAGIAQGISTTLLCAGLTRL